MCGDSSRFVRGLTVWAWAITAVCAAGCTSRAPEKSADESRQGALLVFAAASLQTSLEALIAPIRTTTGVSLRVSYAASSALARQIEYGAPADIFVSADLEWMDYLETRQLIRAESRINLLGNTLVLIAPRDRLRTLSITPGFSLVSALGAGERLAMADPERVPAGRYGRAALTRLGVWDQVAGRIASAENVRAALALVARGEVPLGIVYRSDLQVEPGVRLVDTFPAWSHPPIVYPAALTITSGQGAADVLAFLRSEEAVATFERHGFAVAR